MMEANVFQFLTLVMSVVLTARGQCEPDCYELPAGTQVPDPKYCNRYYTCLAGGLPADSPQECERNEDFLIGVGCVPSYACSPECPPPKCHLQCVGLFDHVIDPFNCSVYYICDSDGKHKMDCSKDYPYYDQETKICTDDPSYCCKPSCDPACEFNAIVTPDPTDCTRYHFCNDKNLNHEPIFPPEECPLGEVYDASIGKCSSSVVCSVWCSSTGSCNVNFLCPSSGYFRKCDFCDPSYFYCPAADQTGIEQTCPDGLVFNPVPGLPYCLEPELCPTESLIKIK